jgi:lysophospholipase L1-like esterase
MPASVINKGACGRNSRNLRASFETEVLDALPKPTHALIYIGMNDVINDRFFVPLPEYLDNIAWLVSQARAAAVTPILCTMHPVVEESVYATHPRALFGPETVNEKRARYNAALADQAALLAVDLVDFAALAERNGQDLLGDGVHLTAKGNELLADAFLDALAPSLTGRDILVCCGDSLTYGYGNVGAGTSQGETYPAFLQRRLDAFG